MVIPPFPFCLHDDRWNTVVPEDIAYDDGLGGLKCTYSGPELIGWWKRGRESRRRIDASEKERTLYRSLSRGAEPRH